MHMDQRLQLGKLGEKQAARFLKRKGFRIVTRNYACPRGEIDIVALDGKVVVFVEVKTRSNQEHADPIDAVDRHKQRQLTNTAKYFLKHTISEHSICRYDVITLISEDQGSFDIQHYEDAFAPSDANRLGR